MTNEPGWGGVWKSALGWDSRAKLATGNSSGEIVDAVRFARERLGFEPDSEQARALRGGRRGIVLCTRQWGKKRDTCRAMRAVDCRKAA